MEWIIWLALIAAAAASSLFLIRNFAPIVVARMRQHAALMLGSLGYVLHDMT